MKLSHFNKQGRARMIDVSEKEITHRVAIARGKVIVNSETLKLILDNKMKKGDVLSTAQIGGIMGGKMTSTLIPMCHNIVINGIDIDFNIDEQKSIIEITATAKTDSKTGIEMEALMSVSIAALTIYDMCKSVDKTIKIQDIRLIKKSGGKSGEFISEEE